MPGTDTSVTRVGDLRSAPRRAPTSVILALACLAQFMVVLDVSVVNVALPAIKTSLGFTNTGLQWVVNAYVLTFAGFLMLGGRIADLFGRRRVFIFGLALFSVASLVGGFAQNAMWLTAARAVQGLGGAVLSPATLTIIMTTFTEGERRIKALGTWSAVAGSGGALGVVLGGVLTSALSWRWVLFINVPVGIIGLALAVRYLSEARSERKVRLDIAGAVTVTAGLAVLIYAIVGTDQHPWTSKSTLGSLAIAAALLAVFFVIQTRSSYPLMPLGLFRSRSVSGANLTMLTLGAAFFSFWYFLSLYLQGVLGYSALKAGLAFFPMGLFIAAGAQVSSRLLTRLGARTLIAFGMVMAAVGLFSMAGIGVHSVYLVHILVPGSLVSLGFGIAFTPLASAATSGVPPHQAGLASGLVNTSRQVGGSIGLAVLATIATSRTAHETGLGHPAAEALTSGYARVFVIGGTFILAGVVAITVILRHRGESPTSSRPVSLTE